MFDRAIFNFVQRKEFVKSMGVEEFNLLGPGQACPDQTLDQIQNSKFVLFDYFHLTKFLQVQANLNFELSKLYKFCQMKVANGTTDNF